MDHCLLLSTLSGLIHVKKILEKHLDTLERLCNEFHEGKIQYAFLKVINETNNKLAKLVLIAWVRRALQ